MKICYFFLVILSISSCTPTYQLFEISSTDTKTIDKSIVFENKDVKLSYDFWSDGGQVYFKFTNKTDSELYIDWDKSHLIYNGISFEYWNDVEESSSFYSSLTSASSSTFSNASLNIFGISAVANSNNSTSTLGKNIAAMSTTKTKPKKIIFLPANASVVVSRFTISKSAYYNCDFNLKSKKSKSISFTKENTPLEFRNQIVYSHDDKFNNKTSIDNSFFISSISFISQKLFNGETLTNKNCNIDGTKSTATQNEFPFKKENRFYVKASKGW